MESDEYYRARAVGQGGALIKAWIHVAHPGDDDPIFFGGEQGCANLRHKLGDNIFFEHAVSSARSAIFPSVAGIENHSG